MRRTLFLLLLCMASFLTGCGSETKLRPLPLSARVLAFGDSLTFGVGADFDENYPAMLEELIKREVINAGIPGETTSDGLKRLPLVLDKYQPRLIVLCHGFSDLLRNADYGQVADNVRAMVELTKSRGIDVVLVASPKIRLMVAPALFYMTIAMESGIPIEMGMVSHVLNDDTLKSDRLYPNDTGYRRIAEAVADTLAKAGAI